MESKLTIHGNINRLNSLANESLKHLRIFRDSSEMLNFDDIKDIEAAIKATCKVLAEMKKEVEPYKQLANLRYGEITRNNKSSISEVTTLTHDQRTIHE